MRKRKEDKKEERGSQSLTLIEVKWLCSGLQTTRPYVSYWAKNLNNQRTDRSSVVGDSPLYALTTIG